MIAVADHDLETIQRILSARVPEFEVRAFGSRYRWTAKDYSDLDLAIVGERPLTLSEMANLRADFEDSDLPFRVDVLDWQAISPEFRRVIEQGYAVIQNRGLETSSTKWETTTLGDVAEIVSGGTPSTKNSEYWNPEIEWVTAKDISESPTARIHNTERHISKKGLANSPAKMLPALSTVLIARGATMGKCRMIAHSMAMNQTCYALVAKQNTDPIFLYYALSGLYEHFRAMAHGSIFDTVIGSGLREVSIPFPPLAEQRAIAHILGSLDDKIELNRRMNETLEAIARALFKSWFVDFDPVRAKAEGREPVGMDAETAALFPDGFEDSELGEIPRGWKVVRLSELCSTQYGFTASSSSEVIGPKFLRVMDINKQNWIEWESVPYCAIEESEKHRYLLQKGDIVVARMADPGKSAMIEEDSDAIFASYLVRLKTKSLADSYYVYYFLKSDQYSEYAEGVKSGSVQANMNAKVIVGAGLLVPPDVLLERFLGAVLPLRQQISANVKEAQTLAALRDALLPKLISGEIRVKDTRTFIEVNS